MIELGSSWRTRRADETIATATRLASSLGISRVTDITRLDRTGIPVAVAIRPDARAICVSAGKGTVAGEARVGAVMEAIEFAWAEPERNRLPVELRPVRDLGPIADLAPILGTLIDLEGVLPCVAARRAGADAPVWVPAELVFHPMPAGGAAALFGTGTNGLCSGNSHDEALLHGLAELLERDALSFFRCSGPSALVPNASITGAPRRLIDGLLAAGFEVIVRSLPTLVGAPCFLAAVADDETPELTLAGYGCHPSSDIALVRAIVESAQTRAALVHGGRDDLPDILAPYRGLAVEQRRAVAQRSLRPLRDPTTTLPYPQIPSLPVATIEDALALIVRSLAAHRIGPPIWVRYTPDDYPIHVLRVIVPGLECFGRDVLRVGRRLRAWLEPG